MKIGRVSGLLAALMLPATLAACESPAAAPATPPPAVSPRAAPSPSSSASNSASAQSWAGRGSLAVYTSATAGGKNVVYVVGINGATARLLAQVTVDRRSGLAAPACGGGACGGAVEPPAISTTRSSIYLLVGDSAVEALLPDGSLKGIRLIPGSSSNRAVFAVSPDDAQIAVSVIDFGIAASKVFVENLRGGGHVDVVTSPAGLVYWPVGWHEGKIVLGSGLPYDATPWNPYKATGYAIVDPVAGARPVTLSSPNCVPTGLLSLAGTACVSDIGAQCLGNLVSRSGNYYYYSSCLRRLDWSGKETVFLLPNYYQTSSMLGNVAALSPNGRAIITDWLFVAMEPDPRGFGGNQFVLGYGNPSGEQDVGWIDEHHVTWSFKYPDGSAAQRIIQVSDDYASSVNVSFDGYPEIAGAPQSPVTGHLAGTVPESV